MKSGHCKAVIFDLDGTLVDTIGDIAAAMNRVLRTLGFPEHPVEAYKNFVGYGLRITARKALPPEHRDEKALTEAGERLVRYYAEHPVDTTHPYEGIPEMLKDLQTAGIPSAILSNKTQRLVEMVVRDLLKGFEFTRVLGADNGYPLKPDPSSALALTEDLGLAPEDILFVGDSEVDIQTARAAGMFPAAVSWGFRTPRILKDAGAALIFEKPRDIPDFMNHTGGKGDM